MMDMKDELLQEKEQQPDFGAKKEELDAAVHVDTTSARVSAHESGSHHHSQHSQQYSPWSRMSREERDPDKTVVGWRAGEGLTATAVKNLAKKERQIRHDLRALRNAAAAFDEKTEEEKAREARPDKGRQDPLKGLPPQWIAFYRTMPHLDAQAAYQDYLRKQKKQQTREELLRDDKDDETLEKERRGKQDELEAQKKELDKLDRELARARKREAQEEEASRRVARKLETASYEYGIEQGKLRSSDMYFHFLDEDGRLTHQKKVTYLQRSAALMKKQIEGLRVEVKTLRQLDADGFSDVHSRSDLHLPESPGPEPPSPVVQEVAQPARGVYVESGAAASSSSSSGPVSYRPGDVCAVPE